MRTPPVHVLVVDDEGAVRTVLRDALGRAGYRVGEAATGRAALEAMGAEPDLMILDLRLPDMTGLDIIRTLRAAGRALPILVLSSQDDASVKVDAFDAGADDYLTKPFGLAELLARIRRTIRNARGGAEAPKSFETGGLTVDLVRRAVSLDGLDVKLTPKEYELLALFVHHAGRVLTHTYLLTRVWGSTTDPQHLRFYIRQLRLKVERSPEQPEVLTSVPGVGYRLRAADRG